MELDWLRTWGENKNLQNHIVAIMLLLPEMFNSIQNVKIILILLHEIIPFNNSTVRLVER